MIKYKGHEDLLRALALIKDDLGKKWKLLCVGNDTGIKDSLKKLAYELKIEKNILFFGSLDNPFELMSVSDIGVLASHEEGFSNSIIEYMSSSLAVIATNVGGNKYALNFDECGKIIDVKDIKKLSEEIKLFLDKNLS